MEDEATKMKKMLLWNLRISLDQVFGVDVLALNKTRTQFNIGEILRGI